MAGISNHFDTMTFIKSIVDGLELPGIMGSLIQEIPEYQDAQIAPLTLPFISIAPWGTEDLNSDPKTPVDKDSVFYPTTVIIFGKVVTGDGFLAAFEQRLGWRQCIRRNLNNRRIPGLTQNWNLVVKPGNIVAPGIRYDRVAFMSSMIVQAKFQEPRETPWGTP